MQSFVKVTLTTIGLVLILIGVIGILALTQAQNLLTKAMDDVLTEAFGSSATVKTVSLSPSNRAVVLHDFALANPQGFEAGDALRCARVEVRMRPRTLLSKTPIIEMLDIEGADIYYRYELGRGTNIAVLAKRLAERADESTSTYKVEKLRCRGAKLHLSANFIPGPDLAMNVVNIRLENLDNGAPITSAEATSIFLRSVLVETLSIKGLLSPAFNKIRREVDDLSEEGDSAKGEPAPERFNL